MSGRNFPHACWQVKMTRLYLWHENLCAFNLPKLLLNDLFQNDISVHGWTAFHIFSHRLLINLVLRFSPLPPFCRIAYDSETFDYVHAISSPVFAFIGFVTSNTEQPCIITHHVTPLSFWQFCLSKPKVKNKFWLLKWFRFWNRIAVELKRLKCKRHSLLLWWTETLDQKLHVGWHSVVSHKTMIDNDFLICKVSAVKTWSQT